MMCYQFQGQREMTEQVKNHLLERVNVSLLLLLNLFCATKRRYYLCSIPVSNS